MGEENVEVGADIEYQNRVDSLVKQAVEQMRVRYGESDPQDESKAPKKKYHNADHARAAVNAVERMADIALLTNREKNLLRIAMAYHDWESSDENDLNEKQSAEHAIEEMRTAGFDEGDIDLVREMIMATKFKFVGSVMMQEVDSDNERVRLLKQIAADADLSGLGSPWEVYRKNSVDLGQESRKDTQSVEFWEGQIRFMSGFVSRGYYTQAARVCFPEAENNLEGSKRELEAIVNKLKRAPDGGDGAQRS